MTAATLRHEQKVIFSQGEGEEGEGGAGAGKALMREGRAARLAGDYAAAEAGLQQALAAFQEAAMSLPDSISLLVTPAQIMTCSSPPTLEDTFPLRKA